MKLHRLQREVEQSAHEAEKRQHEMETMYEVISDERDRVMLSNEALKNEVCGKFQYRHVLRSRCGDKCYMTLAVV